MNAAPTDAEREQMIRGRWLVGGLAALFFVPLALAFWLYYSGGWRPGGSTAHGELIVPARPLEDAPFTLADGTTAARADLLRGKWTLVYVGDGRCDAACQRALWVARQARQLLAEDMSRVQRVFIATAGCCNAEFLAREHPGLDVVQPLDPAARELVARFPTADAPYSLYVVDPLGNLMMRFDTRGDPTGLLEDLKKLLKLSHIG
ncbi:MAG: hypothetical protein U1F11_07555 [Steroidobacteraceae bacterium]